MLEALLKSKFYSRSKSEIKLTRKRIEIIKRKRTAMKKFLRNDVADLLKNGLDSNAYDRVEQLYADQILSSCYEFVEQSCFLILSHLSAMDKHRECPKECKETISTLMFAAARFADLPELRVLRILFAERYGNCLEPYVNQEFVKNMKAEPPTKEIKLQMIQEIALECGIQWDSKALEQKMYKSPPFLQQLSQYANERNKESHKPHHQNGLEANIQETEKRHRNKQTELAMKDHTLGNGLPYKSRVQAEKKEEKHKDLPSAEVEKKREEKHGHGRVSPYWSSNSSSCSESTTSLEYSTDPDDSASEDLVGRKFFGFRSMAPPYVKTDSSHKKDTSSEEEVVRPKCKDNNLQSGSEEVKKLYGFRSMAPPYMKTGSTSFGSSREQEVGGSKCKDPHEEKSDINTKAVKPVPRSMRVLRPLKPVPGSHGNNEVPKPSPKFLKIENHDHNDHDLDHRDKEEEKMDELLLHYSRKSSKLACDPRRTGSLSSATLTAATEERKGFARAATYQADSGFSTRGHVHPKLPDYDDFVAQLAALRASSQDHILV